MQLMAPATTAPLRWMTLTALGLKVQGKGVLLQDTQTCLGAKSQRVSTKKQATLYLQQQGAIPAPRFRPAVSLVVIVCERSVGAS
jgi:hypothetical protein